MRPPLVSIILTSYNKPKMVGKAIKSVIEQSYPHWELFIMDDASDEETTQVIKKYLDDNRIYYFNSEIEDRDRYKTTRYATLINEGIEKAKGKYLSYLTDDTVYTKNRLKRMVTFLESNRGLDIVYSSQKLVKTNEENDLLSEKVRKTKGILSNAGNIVDHCSVMHTRKVADKVFHRFQQYWPNAPHHWHNGDAAFWKRLNLFAKFYPLDEVLDISYKTPLSFQQLNAYLPEELPEGILVKGYLPTIYLLENNERREVKDLVFEKLAYDPSHVISIPDPHLFKYNIGPPLDERVFEQSDFFPNNRLVSAGNEEIYYTQNGKKRKITNLKTFEHYNFSREDMVILEKDLLHQFEEDQPLFLPSVEEYSLPNNTLFYHGEKYYLSQDNRLHEIDEHVLAKLKMTKEKAVMMTEEESARFKRGSAFEWIYYNGKKTRKRKRKVKKLNAGSKMRKK